MHRWEELAQLDPLFVILTDKENAHGQWNLDAFFETGREEVGELFTRLDELDITLPEQAQALDFGCGVGRLSQALAERGMRVTGVDIAPRMIELAKEFAADRKECLYLLNELPNLMIFEEEQFDFVYTSKVLFHLTPALQASYLREFFRIVRPGGLLVFGSSIYAPAKNPWQAFHARYKTIRRRIINRQIRYYALRGLGMSPERIYERYDLRPMMPMHTQDEAQLQALVDDCGGKTIAVDKVLRRHRMNATWYIRAPGDDGRRT